MVSPVNDILVWVADSSTKSADVVWKPFVF